jgi:hypothetical protein
MHVLCKDFCAKGIKQRTPVQTYVETASPRVHDVQKASDLQGMLDGKVAGMV